MLSAKTTSEEQKQLDEILNELIGEPVFSGGRTTPSSGSLTTQAGHTRTVVSWDSTQAGPSKSMTVTKQSVSAPSPATHSESYSTLERREMNQDGYSSREENKVTETRSNTVEEFSMTGRDAVLKKYGHLPYKVDYGNGPARPLSPDALASLSETELWLAEQNVKLDIQRGVLPKRSEQEKRLVQELKSAQSKLKGTKHVDTNEREDFLEQFSAKSEKQMRTSEENYDSLLSNSYRSMDSSRSTGSSRHNGYMESHTSPVKSPPPLVRSPPPMVRSPPLIDRPSSTPPVFRPAPMKDQRRYQETDWRPKSPPRTTTPIISDWRPKSPPRSSPITIVSGHVRQGEVFKTTSPRGFRPMVADLGETNLNGDNHKTEGHYYVTGIERPPFTTNQTKYTFTISPPIRTKPPMSPAPTRVSAPTSPTIPIRTSSKDVISRSRSLNREGRNDDLEKSLAALISTPVSRPPPPEDEEIITLEPIGRGVHELEPEGVRPATPAFPVHSGSAPSTPMFPVAPPTPYANHKGMSASSQQSERRSESKQASQSSKSGIVATKSNVPSSAVATSQPGVVTQQQSMTRQIQHQQYTKVHGPYPNTSVSPSINQPMDSIFHQQQQQGKQPGPFPAQGVELSRQIHEEQRTQRQIVPGQSPQETGYSSVQKETVQKEYGAQKPGFASIERERMHKEYGPDHPGYTSIDRESIRRNLDEANQIYDTNTTNNQGMMVQQKFTRGYDTIDSNRSMGASSQSYTLDSNASSRAMNQDMRQDFPGYSTIDRESLRRNLDGHSHTMESHTSGSRGMNHTGGREFNQFNALPMPPRSTTPSQQSVTGSQGYHDYAQPTNPGQKQFGADSTIESFIEQRQSSTLNSHNGVVQNGSLSVDTTSRGIGGYRSPSMDSPASPAVFSGGPMTPGNNSIVTGQSSPSVYLGHSRRGSLSSLESGEIVHHTPRFVKDTSKYWYKKNISRNDAISLLKDKPPGTFIVRDSNTFPGAFGLALKVKVVPPNVQTKGEDENTWLVRHFLIEPTPKGVRLKGCINEPVFASLAALVYQHSITPLALPCKLVLPESDVVDGLDAFVETNSNAQLYEQGAACDLLYGRGVDMESLTGSQAIGKAIKETLINPPPKTTVVHFKVSSQGVTVTDNKRKLFFRRHYPMNSVTYCGLDPEERKWRGKLDENSPPMNARLFGFVARKPASSTENACHIFAEMDPQQPPTAILQFMEKVLFSNRKNNKS